MALLSRLFSSRKNKQPKNLNGEKSDRNFRPPWKPFVFNKDQVRVLLFRECDWRGRKLLFDSNAVQKVPLESTCKLRFAGRSKLDKTKKDGFVEVTNGYGYQYTKPSADAKLLGEMMFGAVAMTYRGAALKVHALPDPRRLMFTRVFPSPEMVHPNKRTSDKSLEDSFGSSMNSMSEYCSRSGSESLLESVALDVPAGDTAGGYNSLAGDSGFCGEFSLQSVSSVGSNEWTPCPSTELRNSFGSLQANRQSGGSLSSLQRRWIRNMSTSLEQGVKHSDDAVATQHRRTKLGLSVLITLTEEQHSEMEQFIFEHMSVIESMLERLRHAVERAYSRKDTFVHVMHDGWHDVQQALHDMLCMPRLACPLWLHLGLNSADGKCPANLAATFVQDLCQLVATLDTKATNFFVSTLVTGVLTHHLGWVNTVCPNTPIPNAASSPDAGQSLHELSRSYPYNPLWAQLGDLYGALGSPTKVAKTIITTTARRHDCVNKLLTSMTYFIRCGEVKQATNLSHNRDELRPCDAGSASSSTLKPSQSSVTMCGQFANGRSFSDEDLNKSAVNLDINSPFLVNGALLRSGVDPMQRQPQSDPKSLSLAQLSSSKPCDLGENCKNSAFVESFTNRSLADKPKRTDCQKTEQLETRIQSSYTTSDLSTETVIFSSQEETEVDLRREPSSNASRHRAGLTSIKSPIANLNRTSCRSGVYVDDLETVLSSKVEGSVVGQPSFREKKFDAQALRGGNFCSPAGVEWEIDEYRARGSDSELITELESGLADMYPFPKSRQPCIGTTINGTMVSECVYPDLNEYECRKDDCGLRFRQDVIGSDDIICSADTMSRNRNVCGNKEAYDVKKKNIGQFDVIPTSVTQENGNDIEFRRELTNGVRHFSSGLKSMKRTSSCRKKLSDMLENRGTGIYPDIADLAKMENVRLSEEPAYLEQSNHERKLEVEISNDPVERADISPQIIAEKVTKLSRVPTSAVLFHLESETEGELCNAVNLEHVTSKRFDCERQMTAHDTSRREIQVMRTRDQVKDKPSEVLFVLGDDEQLRGIKPRSANSTVVVQNHDVRKTSYEDNLVSSRCELRGDTNEALEPKVVMVKSSFIDMESEGGPIKTDYNNKSYLKQFLNSSVVDCVNENTRNSISRSSSINLPVSKRNRTKKLVKSRRYTEIYCDKCKALLKQKRDGILNERDTEKSFQSCEKCYYSDRNCGHDGNGAFQRTKSEKNGLNLLEGQSSSASSSQEDDVVAMRDTSDIESSLEVGVAMGKGTTGGNAMFEQYNPSDEEILGTRGSKAKPHPDKTKEIGFIDLHLVELPLPSCHCVDYAVSSLAASLFGGVSPRYVPDLVLQGCSCLPAGWEAALRRDLSLAVKLPLLGQDVAEAVCLVADTNTWEVQLVSSHAYVVDKAGSFGVRVGMSQLVANMLESLVLLWRLKTPPELCLQHLENKLRELFLRSQSLAELLLTTDFCNMALLTTALDLEANDVPLLLAVATTHSPQIAERYGLSFV